MRTTGRGLLLALVLPLAAAFPPVSAGGTREDAVDPPALFRGQHEGVAVTRGGRLFLAPRLDRVQDASSETADQIWAAAAAPSGELFLGSGPEGRILRAGPTGRVEPWSQVEEPLVTALAVLPGGDVLAGASPEGTIYRIRPNGSGESWAETGEPFVWALAAGEDGRVWAATGDHGRIFEIDRTGRASLFFDSDEAHIVSLLPLPGGGLLAGGAGRGLLFELDAEGHAAVLLDAELPEVRAIAQRGTEIVAALFAPRVAGPRRPAVRLRLPGAAPGDDGVGELDEAAAGPTVEGFIEGLPSPPSPRPVRPRGRVVRLSAEGVVHEIWRSTEEAPFCLGFDADGRLLFGTGEPGRLYREETDGDVALLATLAEAQITSIAAGSHGVAVAASSPAAVYRLRRRTAESGVFLASPLDAGAVARWGSLAWRPEGRPDGVELYTRTGNGAIPDVTWSAWSPVLPTREGVERRGNVVNPDGRFLQWRAKLIGGGGRGPGLAGVRVRYVRSNRPPSVPSIRALAPFGSVAAEARFRFEVADPDGDPLSIELQFRGDDAAWRPAVRTTLEEVRDGDPARGRTGELAWDSTGVSEGRYDLRVVVSDAGANAPGEGTERTARLPHALAVDRTAPAVEARWAAGGDLVVEVRDDLSSVLRLEWVRDGVPRFRARPRDGVSDSRDETFAIPGESLGDGSGVLRAVDAAGNVTENRPPPR